MAAVGRLHPRYWDGHRLLQFLTGLALLALAFGTTAASAAPASPSAPAVTTAVEAAPGVSALGNDEASTPVRSLDSDGCRHDANRAAPPVAAVAPAAVAAPAVAPAADGDTAPAAPSAADAVGAPAAMPRAAAVSLAGIAQQAHGSRAPPR